MNHVVDNPATLFMVSIPWGIHHAHQILFFTHGISGNNSIYIGVRDN
jgi:hypothetical protein